MAVSQIGRYFDGGASGTGFATSTDGGATWTSGALPGLTTHQGAPPYERATDPVVAYDPEHGVWLAQSLLLDETASGPHGSAVVVNRSTDGGLTWSAPAATANNATGLGGQPVVQPDGDVIVPAANAFETAIIAFRSTNGGASWSNAITITSTPSHNVAGNLRTGPLPSAEIDAAGRVYVVWQDCRFRKGCKVNDIVMTTSDDGVTWSPITRVPIDTVNSSVDHFIPGIGVDPSTSGGSARLGLTYYFYRASRCGTRRTPCQLEVGYVQSNDGGTNWSNHTDVAGPFPVTWTADTTQGRMVGDYISTSWLGGRAYGAFASTPWPTRRPTTRRRAR